MSRIVIVGTKTHIDEAIQALYDVKAVHLIDHTVGADEGFTIGTPRPYSSKASERLLKVRAMVKGLGITKKTETAAVPEDEIKSQISSDSVEAVEAEVNAVFDRRNDLNQRITELNANKKSLELVSRLPINLEDYSGYRSIFCVVGTIADDPADALKGMECEVFFSQDKKLGNVAAVFARVSDRDAVTNVLSGHGFAEFAVPEGYSGSAATALSTVDKEIAAAEADLAEVGKEIEGLLEKHKDFLGASEEELSIEVEKGELPLRIATSGFTFVIDAWVPTKKAGAVKTELESKVESIYVEIEEDRGRSLEGLDDVEPRFRNPPTKMNNGVIAKEFEYPTKLVDVPKYQEIDPTILIAIFFPLFFGLMVGDVGYSIPFIILGAYGLKVTHHKDWRAIATVFLFGGIWAFIFGFFFYGEFLGMHFIGHVAEGDVEYTWEYLLSHYLGLETSGLESFFSFLPGDHGVGKISADWIGFLMKLTVYIGLVHLCLGYCCSIYNKTMQHGFKHAFMEKGGWLLSFLGLTFFCYGLANYLIYAIPNEAAMNPIDLYAIIIGLVVMIIGVVMNYREEKIQAILELPGIVGNILSYTRLAAIGMSKAGMALAFNYIAIHMFYDSVEGIIGFLLCVVMMAFGHLMIWTLAILSAGLHGLRLQYVEFMAKFFEGGGTEFEPLKIKRKKTVSTTQKAKANEV
ncbi:MAG: V-type ATP synthase subunit I [Thermoplasmata archaeon]|nr:V-type ATP synthase subunit I [Thermoplasmata archaeon]